MSIDLAASVAIIHNGQILLTQRQDVEAWSLPGGRVEVGESVAETAIREAYEETGLKIQLTRLVGIYFVPNWREGNNHEVLFAAKPIGGRLQPQLCEVIDEGFFDPGELPEPLLWWHRQRIRDAIDGIGGSVVWLQRAEWPFEEEPQLRTEDRITQSGLSRQEFFLKYFSKPKSADLEVLLVGKEKTFTFGQE